MVGRMVDNVEQYFAQCVGERMLLGIAIMDPPFKIIGIYDYFERTSLVFIMNVPPSVDRMFIEYVIFRIFFQDPGIPDMMGI